MMCLECASAAAGGAEEEEADAERRRRRRGAQRGAGGGGCCGARGAGGAGVSAADDEVQTLSGSVRRAPAAAPGTPGTPGCAAAAKGPGAQQPKPASLGRGRGAAAAILSLGNVLNYLDRYTVAGVLLDIQQHFGVKDRGAGLLQSVFICSFMVAAPIFGYLGDRFNRKVILSCGIFFWSAVTFSSSFIPQQYFWLLVLSRGLVGIGEASYSTIAPTIIGDLFTNNTRTLMLSVFYFAIPLGSGLGYITGSSVKQAAGDWHWALRVSPVLGMITGTLILILVPATKRGHADQLGDQLKARTSWLRDMKALIRKGPGHVDPTVPAPRTSRAEDGGVMQQPALWGQGQPHLWGHHLLYGLPGRGHGCGSHALVPPEDPAGRPPGVCRGHAGLCHLHLPDLRGCQEQHRRGLYLYLCRGDTAVFQLGHHRRHPHVRGHPHPARHGRGLAELHLPPAGGRREPLPHWLYLRPDPPEHQGLPALGVPEPGLRAHALPLRRGPGGHVLPRHGAILPQRPCQG
ncbi:protein spinster homolog 2 isoform X4 [Sapajus apella]|uniref:Protein spinster homolog 2 isoform X4 n=1 Tax=Sapajus apella TaxID=9515 RepID=A0A6J3HC42_SAPAP|nr:protein spinster homolog 2 isoform X4 [Sapajus apella]XP_032127600.1 protein spinster homolog 2 isoform X4 [Sapajus apella]